MTPTKLLKIATAETVLEETTGHADDTLSSSLQNLSIASHSPYSFAVAMLLGTLALVSILFQGMWRSVYAIDQS